MRSKWVRMLTWVMMSLLPVVCTSAAYAGGLATGKVTITPTSHDFHTVAVGLKTDALDIDVTNTGGQNVTVTSFSLDNPGFQLTQGVAPAMLSRGVTTHYTVLFAPTAAQVYTGTFTVNVSNGQVLTVSLTGTGYISTAQASLSSNLLDFGTAVQGQTIAKQTLTITNTGTGSMQLAQVLVEAPFSTNFKSKVAIAPGTSFPLTVTFNPTVVGPATGLVVLCYDTVPEQGVNLTGTVTAANKLAISNFPMLPKATQGAAYLGYLTATAGTPPYTWKLMNGSTLPTGLTLDPSTGNITGTVASSVKAANYAFTAIATDSSVPPKNTSKQIQLTVGAPTGAICNNISWNVSGTNSPIVPLDVLGTGTYLGSEGGLYPDGSNVRPADHDAYGISLAQQIQPLNADGQPDPNGKAVVVTIGESNVQIEGGAFSDDATVDSMKNPSVLVANGALGNATAANLSQTGSAFWTTITDWIIPNYGVTANQVVAAWVEPADSLNTGTFPSDISTLQSQIESETQNLLIYFPNIKLAYFSSRIYAGYSNGLSNTNPEPYAYEDGFAVKWAIQDQLNGNANLNFDPSKGPVLAPWMSWGPYTWANGLLIPNTTGLLWSCQDIKNDGVHPSTPGGRELVGQQVLDFFKTDATTTPWFLAH